MTSPLRTSPLTPQFRFDTRGGKAAGRYVDIQTGRYVKRSAILGLVEKQIETSRGEIRKLSKQLQAEAIDLLAWRAGMIANIKTIHMAEYALGKGGWGKLNASDWGKIGATLKKQYAYLNGFVADMQKQYAAQKELDGRFLVRAGMYADAGHATYEQAKQLAAYEVGMRYERRTLDPASQHCTGCLKEAARGWQPIYTTAPIGSTECRSACRCDKIFKRVLV